MAGELITDAELLSMGMASNALAAITSGDRDVARATASSFVLSYLRKRFKLPLVSWSADVKRATAHIATYDLLARRGYNPLLAGDAAVAERYNHALQWVRDVAVGKAEPESIVDTTPDVHECAPLVATEEAQWRPYGRRR